MSATTTRYTVDEYFERELSSELKHEYIDGEIIQMVGGSTCHNKILENLYRLLFVAFSPPMYRVCVDNVRLRISTPVRYVFPDAMLVKEPAQYEDGSLDTLLNPLVVFEVLSPSTELKDRGPKANSYKRIDSVEHYVLISQDQPTVECYSRQSDGEFLPRRVDGTGEELEFPDLGWNLKLTDLYRSVNFPVDLGDR